MNTLKLRFKGIRPMIHQNPQSMFLGNELAQKRYDLNARTKAARKKQDNFHELQELQQESMKLDWMASLYLDEKGNPYVPAEAVMKCLENGASGKVKKEIITNVTSDLDRIPIQTVPKWAGLKNYGDPAWTLFITIRVPPRTGARNYTAKPMMPTGWSIDVPLLIGSGANSERVIKAAIEAGACVGLGGWRPRFGRFEVEVL